jgi:hypothetical protein
LVVLVEVLPEKLLDLVVVGFLVVLEDLVLLDLLELDFEIDIFGDELFTLKLEREECEEKEERPPLNPLASAKLGTIKVKVNNKANIAFDFIFLHPFEFLL